MGIRWHVPGFSKNAYDTRPGATQIFWDEKNHFLTIDGYYFHGGLDRMLADLKLIGAAADGVTNRMLITHWHIDHYGGIWKALKQKKDNGEYTFNIDVLYCPDPDEDAKGLRNNDGSKAVKKDLDKARALIAEAKARGIKVVYLKSGHTYKWGDIEFTAYRERPAYVSDSDTNGWEYMNWGSFFCWFESIKYLAVGDGPKSIGDFCKKHGIKPVFINGVHHGNGMARVQSQIMWDLGVRYYWDNDLSKGITPFLETGREDAIAVGMKFISIIGDINGFTYNGYMYVIHEAKIVAKYKCDAPGVTFKSTTAGVVRKAIRGSYGNGDRRMTYLLKLGYSPINVQAKANKVIDMAKGIKSGRLDYGRDKARLAKIDAELGKGYGQLVQDYINMLYGRRKAV